MALTGLFTKVFTGVFETGVQRGVQKGVQQRVFTKESPRVVTGVFKAVLTGVGHAEFVSRVLEEKTQKHNVFLERIPAVRTSNLHGPSCFFAPQQRRIFG